MLAPYEDAVLLALANPRTGILKTAKFLPTLAELSEWCERERVRLFAISAEQDRAERIAAHRALPPPPADEIERRARVVSVVKGGLQKLHAELCASNGIHTKRTLTKAEREAAAAWLIEQQRNPEPPPRLSPSALARMKGAA